MTTVVGLRRPRPGDPVVEVVLEAGERVVIHDRRLSEHGLMVGAAARRVKPGPRSSGPARPMQPNGGRCG